MQNFKPHMSDELFEKRYKQLKRFCFSCRPHPKNSKLILENVWGERILIAPVLRDLIRRFEVLKKENEKIIQSTGT